MLLLFGLSSFHYSHSFSPWKLVLALLLFFVLFYRTANICLNVVSLPTKIDDGIRYFFGEISLFLMSLQSALVWTEVKSNNRHLFLFLQSQAMFSSTYPRKCCGSLVPVSSTSDFVPVPVCWMIAFSLMVLLLVMCHPVNAHPLHPLASNLGAASPVSLYCLEDTCSSTWSAIWLDVKRL